MRRSLLAILLTLSGCAYDAMPSGDPVGVAGEALEHTAEGVGILRLLNEPSTDVALLDERLDVRAATNLIAHRNGPNGRFEEGGGDDDLFDSIAEVDAVSYVGPTALGALRELALWLDFVPGPNELLGTWDGVSFTVSEAERALTTANTASEAVLRNDVGLVSRAVTSILAARPIDHMGELAALYYVGSATLEHLRSFGAAGPGGEPCESDAQCTGGLRCVGIPTEGHPRVGACRDLTPLPGEDAECASDVDCGLGLFCSGLTIYDTGFCRPTWMRTTIDYGGGMSIPSTRMTWPTATIVTVSGLASVPEDIVVDANLTHTTPRALRVSIADPNGDEAVLWDGPNAPAGAVFDPHHWVAGFGISRDAQVNGEWELRIQNVTGGGEGQLDGFRIAISSRWD